MLRSVLLASISSSRNTALNSSRSPAFRRWLSQEARGKIQAAVEASPVVLFMKGNPQIPQCGFSRAAVQVLEMQGVPQEKLKTYDILEDPELRSGIKEFSEWPTIPQIYINAEFVGGCDILLGMHQSGELQSLLEQNNIIPKPSGETSS
ncbi:hypothetical protein PAXRUDRAFT_835020 [Paxillus rubicundulus Ve08.2h10]|uniref:Monothiol glutaredoxin-5, mitochondrial n=1 Tax=Paxillus rubicundulus Ve08.2h10 TaxID=930991 RepID=A0A0D0DH54_9AGAM|nr:hypothetical protein PAXRUDRAFT_835020 [Paxillus rubicundulus Ve08.2h10]